MTRDNVFICVGHAESKLYCFEKKFFNNKKPSLKNSDVFTFPINVKKNS